jgi:diguanylate cyclase (GGDEF)-like protein/PAS domain S-box-containing protein
VASTTEILQRVNSDPELSSLRQLCIDTLLACPEERVFFSDLNGRSILVSAGSLAVLAQGGSPDDAIGKTVHDLFDDETAKAIDIDERHILKTGETVVGKVRRISIPGHADMWMQTTKMPLRDASGAIVGTFGISRDLTAQIEAETALAHQALHDALTGLPNRALILDRLEQMLARTRRNHGKCAAMFLDLDNFKDINDTLGHHAGDELLVAVAERLSNALRTSDTVGRLGGDEFVVLVDGDSMDAGPEVIAERILDVLRTPCEISASATPILASASIGIAEGAGQAADQLLREADIALYQAKAAGKRCAMVFAPTMQTTAQAHRKLSVDLESALEGKQFFLLYQPTIDLQSSEFRGVEALLRWQHPDRASSNPLTSYPSSRQVGLSFL